jgi:hypothetical protein
MKFFIMTAMAVTLFTHSPAFAGNSYSTQQCNAWFNKVDRNNDGSLGASENANMFLAGITLASETDNNSESFIMSKRFFIAECMIGSLGKPP